MNLRTTTLPIVMAFLCLIFFSAGTQAQTFGTVSSAVWLTDCNQSNFFNTSGSGANLIGPAGNVFTNTNLGVHTQNSGTLTLGGAEIRTSKDVVANVCSARMYYRIYLQSGAPGGFITVNLPLSDNCDIPSSQFPSGGSCLTGDQKWNYMIPVPVNLTSPAPGNYVLEVYYDITGSSTSTTLCDETVVLNNSGTNYKSFFSIQSPVLASNNPTTCNGTEGLITISGLVPGATYDINYTDDGAQVGPVNFVANGSGQVIVSGLNAGIYSNFELLINGCSTELFTGIILSNPVFTPTFTKIAAFCAGSIQPILLPVSNNGLGGTWNPAVVNNQSSGNYTFTPSAGQCALPYVMNVTVIQKTTPAFSFGTALTICSGGIVPVLPGTSTNLINGTWSPAIVSNTTPGVYTFTPTAGLCANPTTFTVTVNPNITPTFSFGTSSAICAGGAVPGLPTTSTNGITGTWSPASIDNQNSGTYTFTPTAGICATTTTFDVTVNPNVTPTFSFGTSSTICAGGTVPLLPNISTEGITGTWSPAVVNDQASGTYTFTPTAGLCAVPTTFTVTVTPNITPTFSFGTSMTICADAIVPVLPTTSTNGITGTWNPASIDNQNPGVYIFTPTAGLCALPATFTVTVNPNITPTFNFGTSLTVCENATVPLLPVTSGNGITGTWNPAMVSNQSSGIYTFTPTAGLCATTTIFAVTVDPNVTPIFSIGTSLIMCVNGTVPSLPATSDNGITGTWNHAVVSNAASGVYTFTPTAGLCATPTTFTVTVTPNIIPAFGIGTSLTICANATVPSLPGVSTNGITGTWNPSSIDNQNSGVYTFTPDAGQCALPTTFTVTVNPNITPTFNFGTSLTVCENATVPSLPVTSDNGITGTWNPVMVSNQVSDIYTFTPTAGLCATTTTFTVTVEPNVTPVFSFGTSLTICVNGTVPSLPATSDNGITGTWNPAVVSNAASGVYTFTPTAGLCAIPTTFIVTVTPNIIPTFGIGTSLTICSNATVPSLPGISTNGITGTWSPASIDNQNSDVYTFTPDAGQCALPTTFTVTVNPNITPTFSFGTSLTVCANAVVPALPGVSTNGITGTWSPSVVSNQVPGVYTFTPTAGLCATTTTFTVTVDPNATPVFGFGTSLTICGSGMVPTLPATSTNGITGTWNPAVVNDQASGVYTFTPTAGLCATTATFVVTVNPNITPAFSFGTALTICADVAAPSLPASSTNGITGTWNPASVDNQNSGVYTFTPATGLCAVLTTFTVTVNPNITPTFNFGLSQTICLGGTAPTLPATSINGITGTWSPAIVSNQVNGIYTFTPSAGLCATATTFTATVASNVTPSFNFGTSLTICAGGTVPLLITTSTNGITGTWNPAIVSDQASGVYTFTPDGTVCATTTTYTVTVTPNLTPNFSFGTSLTICADATVPLLPNASTNGIAGTWNPATVDNQNSGSYTFTPSPGICALPATFTVTVNPNITPTFSFGTSATICAGATAPVLPTTSANGITGIWSPSSVDNQNSGVYTFTPTAGLCATTTTLTVTITPNVTPAFNFGTSLTICAGGAVPPLPGISTNGINGTWNPAVVNDQASGVYTFTPASGVCATTATFTVTVNPNITPTFSFGTSLSICTGGAVPALPATSANGINGTWSSPSIDNQNSANYTFTPTAGECATISTLSVTVNPIVTPAFSFGVSTTICSGDAAPSLPAISTNGINGTWLPATIDNQANGIYTFTPAVGECAIATTFTVTATPSITPVFDFGTTLTICTGGTVPPLPATSTNGIDGIWSPATVGNQANGTYTFTPTATPEQCIRTATFTVTVKPILTPTFNFGTAKTICSGSTAPVLPTTSDNGITGTWTPATVNNQTSGTYTFTSAPGQCATATATFAVTVTTTPTVGIGYDTTVNDGAIIPVNNLSGTPAGTNFNWTNSNPAIGLPATGTGNVSSFTATNKGTTPITGTITVTPVNNGCAGSDKTYSITINPLNKDVFVPNVFSPNGDGKNDILFAYGNYIKKLDMRIFNQWGEQVIAINDPAKGWDGTQRGKAQPVGVYVYVLQAELEDGRTVKLKGSITLLR